MNARGGEGITVEAPSGTGEGPLSSVLRSETWISIEG